MGSSVTVVVTVESVVGPLVTVESVVGPSVTVDSVDVSVVDSVGGVAVVVTVKHEG